VEDRFLSSVIPSSFDGSGLSFAQKRTAAYVASRLKPPRYMPVMRSLLVLITAGLLVLALLPVAAMVSVPSIDEVGLSLLPFIRPAATLDASSLLSTALDDSGSDAGEMTIVGACLLGLAAVVRKATGP
jgi:hypothetical protein